MNDTHWYTHGPDMDAVPRGTVPRDATLIGTEFVPLRVFLRHGAWQTIHGLFDFDKNQTGLLLGGVYADDDGPFIVIDDALVAPYTGIVFTDRSWSHMHKVWQEHYNDRLVIGTFRMRPDGGTSLSPYDRFNAERFFPDWHHLLYVVDPQRQRQALFHWDAQQLKALPGFWVCDDDAPIGETGFVNVATSKVASDSTSVTANEPDIAERPPQLSGRTSFALLAVALSLLLLWACDVRMPGSLPEMRRQIEDVSTVSTQLAAQAEELRLQNEQLESALRLLETSGESAGTTVSWQTDLSGTTAEPRLGLGGLPAGNNNSEHAGSVGSRYVIRQGDTLWTISTRLLGDPLAYTELAEDNEITDPDLILPGWEIRLPAP